jgi:CHAD domain-containing protein
MAATYEFRCANGPDGADVSAALAPRFAVQSGQPRKISRTWLDTFDWRLHRAGLALEYADDMLTLRLPDDRILRCALPGPLRPIQLADLPSGALRDRLAGMIWPRALLPVITVDSTVAESRILDGEEKTVARLLVDRPEGGTARLAVRPLRGYDGAAERVARRLAKLPDMAPAVAGPYAEALADADRSPDRVVPDLTAEMPAAQAIASVLKQFADVMRDNVDGVIDAIDTEFLHDFRVAVRRTRSVLKLAGDVLPDGLAEKYAPEFRWLGDLTTPVRDLDVYLLGFADLADGLVSADPADLASFQSFLRRRRTAERRRLVRGLRSARFGTLMTEWQRDLAAVAAEGPPIGDIARERIRGAFVRVLKHGRAITAESAAERVHTLRKRCKELRYLLEIFRPLHNPGPHRQIVRELKRLQDCLGDFQDGEVQREAVRAFAAEMMAEGTAPAPTVLAMGELAARLDAHQMRARADLQNVLDPFLSKRNRARMGTLT